MCTEKLYQIAIWPDKQLRRRRESKSKEYVSQYPDWLETANPSRNFSVLSLTNPLYSRLAFTESYQIRTYCFIDSHLYIAKKADDV